MSSLAIAAVVYGACAPLAIFWARRVGFLPAGDPIVLLRLPAVVWIGPLLALFAVASAAAALAAHAVGADRSERALAWWREAGPADGDQTERSRQRRA